MWPALRPHRISLASFLVTQGGDAVRMMESMADGWSIRTSNGFVHVEHGPTFSVSLGTFGADAFIPWADLVCLGLHVLWQSFHPNVATAACFVQSKTLINPHAPFWDALFAHTAWILLPPEPIRDAMCIGRPDLAHIVQKGYFEWLVRMRTPAHIDSALEMLLDRPWKLRSTSTLWLYIESIVSKACIQVGVTKALAPQMQAHGVVCTKVTRPVILLDNRIPLVIHARDMVLLIIVLVFGKDTNWADNGVPADAPTQFFAVRDQMPHMFAPDAKQPYVMFDDLPFIGEGV